MFRKRRLEKIKKATDILEDINNVGDKKVMYNEIHVATITHMESTHYNGTWVKVQKKEWNDTFNRVTTYTVERKLVREEDVYLLLEKYIKRDKTVWERIKENIVKWWLLPLGSLSFTLEKEINTGTSPQQNPN